MNLTASLTHTLLIFQQSDCCRCFLNKDHFLQDTLEYELLGGMITDCADTDYHKTERHSVLESFYLCSLDVSY